MQMQSMNLSSLEIFRTVAVEGSIGAHHAQYRHTVHVVRNALNVVHLVLNPTGTGGLLQQRQSVHELNGAVRRRRR